MFRTVPLYTIRSFSPYTQQWYMSYRFCWHLASKRKTLDDGQRNSPKYVEFYSKTKFEKLVHLTYLLTYLLTPWCRVLLENLIGLKLVKKFPAFYETRRFITALTSVRHPSLTWANPIQSTYPHPTSWRSILILNTHLRLGLPSVSFPPISPPRPYTHPLLTHTRHMPSLSYYSRFYYPHNIGWGVEIILLLVVQSPPFPRQISASSWFYYKKII